MSQILHVTRRVTTREQTEPPCRRCKFNCKMTCFVLEDYYLLPNRSGAFTKNEKLKYYLCAEGKESFDI